MSVLSLDRRVAVLLRGPAGVGKSTIGDRLLQIFGASKDESFVNLDDGWGSPRSSINYRRYEQGPARYRDLCKGHRLLVIELAWGEPDGAGPGATLGAQDWLQVLQNENRTLHAFRLKADWPTVEQRLRICKGWSEPRIAKDKERYDKYEAGVLALPAPTVETVFDTSKSSPDEIASLIAKAISR